jgi:homoserine kinase
MPGPSVVISKAHCSSANLGPGFDAFGLALEKYYDIVRAQFGRRGSGIEIRLTGRHAQGIPTETSLNSAGPPALEMLHRARVRKGLEILIQKNIPPRVGLGSSGATAAACVRALDTLLQLALPEDDLVRIASLGEQAVTGNPHADNVAASLLGGFVVVYGKNPVHAKSITPPGNLRAVIATPQVKLPKGKTRLARALVPRFVRVEEAVSNIGRAAAVTLGFALGNIGMIGDAMEDRIAEPYREKLVPGYRKVKTAALAASASGVALSGAGPSVLALVDESRCDPRTVGKAMVQQFAKSKVTSTFFVSRPGPAASLVRSG